MQTAVVIIGAGHAGLAMSRRLAERSIDHTVLERGEVANSWRTERWPSLRLLTPNWQTRLPGHRYEGPAPHGFIPVADVVELITDYADRLDAPVRTDTTVHSVQAANGGFQVATNDGVWRAGAVVLATGACNLPLVPSVEAGVATSLTTLTPLTYRCPDQLPDGGVLVVGASATGCQLADEIHRSGRPVTLSVGEHVRLPRSYRGRDIFWWMEMAGVLDERHDEVDDIVRARHVPSPQLVGTPDGATLDLNTLGQRGVRIVGRLGRISGSVAQFSGSPTCAALADLKMTRLLKRLDDWAVASCLEVEVEPSHRFEPTRSIAVQRFPSICRAGRYARSCGPSGTGPTTRGSTSRCSTGQVASAMTGVSSATLPGCTCSARRCFAVARRPTSTARARTQRS